MKGTEKQIKWANDIKSKAMEIDDAHLFAEIESAYNALSDKSGADAKLANLSGMEEVRAEMDMIAASHDEAGWWIDNRANAAAAIIREMVANW